jgi:hypothetical protein
VIAAHVWNVNDLEQTLDGSILAVGSVENGERDVNRAVQQLRREAERSVKVHDLIGAISR